MINSVWATSFFGLVSALVCTSAFSASMQPPEPNPGDLRIVPMEPTPDPDHVETKIFYPKENEVRTSTPVKGVIHIEGYPLGIDSDLPRKKEVWNDPEGQSLHVFIDDHPYFSVNEAFINALDNVEEYFDLSADFEIPFKLQPGMHVIRTFPTRSYNESVKTNGAFAARIFYFQEKQENVTIDLSQPYLTYNEPQGTYDYNAKRPILLDFYITNCHLSTDGYKVRITIDNKEKRVLTSWKPYYIYGLSKGSHRVRLELIDPKNKLAPGPFNDVTRTISVK